MVGGGLGSNEEASPLELGLEAQAPSRGERRPQGLVRSPLGGAELVKKMTSWEPLSACLYLTMRSASRSTRKEKRRRLGGESAGRTLPRG